MDGSALSVFPGELYSRQGIAFAPVLVDVRCPVDFSSSDRLIVGAFHRPADDVERWRRDLPTDRPVVIYCVAGQKVSQSVVTALRAVGHYVPTKKILAVAKETSAKPYDIDGVELTREGERGSFDTILCIWDIKDPALDDLAAIVRGADTSRHDLTPQCGGLFAISVGLSANFPDAHDMLRHGMVIYDALYAWCRSLQAETHNRRCNSSRGDANDLQHEAS